MIRMTAVRIQVYTAAKVSPSLHNGWPLRGETSKLKLVHAQSTKLLCGLALLRHVQRTVTLDLLLCFPGDIDGILHRNMRSMVSNKQQTSTCKASVRHPHCTYVAGISKAEHE